jgi:triosephosphate isomerase
MTVVGRYTGKISVAILKSIFNDLFMISFAELKDLLNQMP